MNVLIGALITFVVVILILYLVNMLPMDGRAKQIVRVIVIIIGVLFGIAGWLASPTGSARSTRRAIAPPLREYPAYVYAGLAIVVCIYFLSAPTQNLRSFLTTLVIAGLAAFGIHELRKQTAEEFPDASYGDVVGRTKDKVVGAVKDANLGERASKLRLPEMRKPNGGDSSEAATATMPAADQEDARLARLERLATLHEKGVLTDEEFATEKQRVLSSAGKA